MKKRRSTEQIVGLLRQADVDLGKGASVPDVCRRFGISQQTYYRWRTKFGRLDPKMAKQLQELQGELQAQEAGGGPGPDRGTQRYRPRKVDGDRELLGVVRKIVETFPRHGSERTHRVLTGPEAFGGWKVNFKRVHRIWKEAHMQVPQKQRKRRRVPGSSADGCVRHRATHRNHVWSYDFLTERTDDGRQLRSLVV